MERNHRLVAAAVALACSAAAGGALAGPQPTPIGVGPSYQPRPVGPLGAHFRCRSAPLRDGLRVHLELFAHRNVVVVPAAIGVRAPVLRYGRVGLARCRARLWTLDPTGVVWFDQRHAYLGTFFRVWGEPLSTTRLAGFRTRSGTRLLVFRNGERWRGDPRRLTLRDHDELVLELGGYVPPHRSFRFPLGFG